ncbi:halocyanin [Halalkalicoccus paucihalophilus]|uniref:Halocyanin n=1 Tax=Halalkalicoccus paucihalophilus TaxID=1008153 RepID=A0A151AE35_9EURY|nr:halocyanin domain-containing protein [Halalkalicoccus paucihalophilus]KYH25873.1 halocyanin [Halalkalicoccus paucihalophilus]
MTEDRDRDRDLSRRRFIREATIGGAAAVAASGTAAAQQEGGNESGGNETGGNESGGNETGGNESGGEGNESGGNESGGGGGGDQVPAWSSFVQDANNFDGTEDLRGQSEATVQVGAGDGLAFDPAGIWIDTGTTVIWEWTGEGGSHNVSNTGDLGFESETSGEAGFTFEYTFEEGGIFEYECVPHTAQGMHGGVAVGEDIETTAAPTESGGSGGGGGGESAGVQLPGAAKSAAVALTVALSSTLGLTYVFMKYGGDYEGDRVE